MARRWRRDLSSRFVFSQPLAPGRKQTIDEVRRQKSGGEAPKGETVWWVADAPEISSHASSDTRHWSRSRATNVSSKTARRTRRTRFQRSEKNATNSQELCSARSRARVPHRNDVLWRVKRLSLENVSDLKEPIKGCALVGHPEHLPAVRHRRSAVRLCQATQSHSSIRRPARSPQGRARARACSTRRAACSGSQRSWPRCSRCSLTFEDEGIDAVGARSTRREGRKGIQGVLVALRSAGRMSWFAWSLPRVSGLGRSTSNARPAPDPTALYDYKGTDDIFAKINTVPKGRLFALRRPAFLSTRSSGQARHSSAWE